MTKNNLNYNIENSGENNGVIAGQINGDVSINIAKNVRKPRSLILNLIEKIAELNDPLFKYNRPNKILPIDITEYTIEDKINHNNIVKYKEIIDEYGEYGGLCEEAFNIIDNNNIGVKTKILKSITLLYKECKGDLLLKNEHNSLKPIEIIRKNADIIIDFVKDEIEKRLINSGVCNISAEDMHIGLIIITCYAFVNCKILEKPGVSI